ncbi:MAG: iron-containing alcohol dehydrogenase, partial [candidate division Zixibacteria bacterium]|nr:iron-containing alcohol dehydrogenase [candidate division Zixibacteria bacterium]
MPEISVKLKRGAYPIVVGSDILQRLEPLLTKVVRVSEGTRLFVFYDAQVFALHGKYLRAVIKRIDRRASEIVIPAGEKSKSASVLNRIYSFLLSERVSRSDFILAVGGGVISDLVGYAAATTLRGLRWGVVPTTLLGMVDAAIGG